VIGKQLGRYKILKTIGAGGMGEVYLAHDQRLEREVALKVLRPGMLGDETTRTRFRKEALTLSKLNHPNIATIFDSDTQDGMDFLVMEFVPGKTLDERLAEGPCSEEEIADLGCQLAEGLAAAHREGVIHRDLKPGNLRVTPEGRLKILDFGIAKMVRPASETAITMSLSGGVTGTVPYMAPEQLREELLDGRTDVHAAGAVLYEMATGQRPYRAEQQAALIDSILNQEPEPPRKMNPIIPLELETVILKALEKAPADRYQSAEELGEDLQRWRAGTGIMAKRPKSRRWPALAAVGIVVVALALILNPAGIRDRLLGQGTAEASIAVLPCINASGDPEDEAFSDGMTEDLITRLSKLGSLRVINSMTMLHYKNTDKNPDEIAAEVRATAILRSRVKQDQDQVQLSAQLIDPVTSEIIWADQYVRDLEDILNLGNDLAVQVAAALAIDLSSEEQALFATRKTVDAEAWRAYQRGKELLRNRSPQNINSATEYFQQAIAADSTFALAWAGLAESYFILSNPFFQTQAQGYRDKLRLGAQWSAKARETADRALAIDPNLPEALMIKKDYVRALEVNPNSASVHYYYSHHLSYLGYLEKAIDEIETALDLDPASIATNIVMVQKLVMAGEFERARDHVEEVMALNPNHPGLFAELILMHLSEGDYEAADRFQRKFMELVGGNPEEMGLILNAAAGNIPVDATVLSLVEEIDVRDGPAVAAVWYKTLGEIDRTLEALEEAVAIRDYVRLSYVWYPLFDTIRSDPRFESIIADIRSLHTS